MIRRFTQLFLAAALSLSPFVGAQEPGTTPQKPEEEKTQAAPPSTPQWSKYPILALRADMKKARSAAGGSGTEKVVTAALSWLARHQHPEGYWSSNDHHEQCRKGRECENETRYSGSKGPGFADLDVGVTGLAALAFIGRGNTHLHAEKKQYKELLDKTTRWLISQQNTQDGDRKGLIGSTKGEHTHYNHAIATLALAELLLGSGDKVTLSESVALAVDYCLRAQSADFGWKYEYGGKRSDTSITSWMALAVFMGKLCAEDKLIEIPGERFAKSGDKALAWIDLVTARASGRTGYEAPGDEGSRLIGTHPEPYPFKALSSCTAAAVFLRSVLGESDPTKQAKGVKILLADLPQWVPPRAGKTLSSNNFYYWYYGSHAIFQSDPDNWKRWNKALKRCLTNNRRRTGCSKGSWDPISTWGPAGGRVYATAINALTLETYYRYQRVTSPPKPK